MIGAAICIGTAVLIAYFLGRYQGMAAAFESFRPTPPRHDEAPGDCFPCHLKPVSHFGTHTPEA